MKNHPTVPMMTTALETCDPTKAGTDNCILCYLYWERDTQGIVPTGCPCFRQLARDVAETLNRINDFDHSQCADLLAENLTLKQAQHQRGEETN